MKVQIYFNSKFVELIIKSIMFELRFVTLRELELLQGFKKVKWPKKLSRFQKGSMVGNAMSLPVLKAAMVAALRAAGMVK